MLAHVQFITEASVLVILPAEIPAGTEPSTSNMEDKFSVSVEKVTFSNAVLASSPFVIIKNSPFLLIGAVKWMFFRNTGVFSSIPPEESLCPKNISPSSYEIRPDWMKVLGSLFAYTGSMLRCFAYTGASVSNKNLIKSVSYSRKQFHIVFKKKVRLMRQRKHLFSFCSSWSTKVSMPTHDSDARSATQGSASVGWVVLGEDSTKGTRASMTHNFSTLFEFICRLLYVCCMCFV